MYQTEQAIDLIRKSDRIVALSGAGISTEAGIPDFRGPGGIWEDPAVLEQLSISGFRRDPEGFYRTSMKLFSMIASAKPTFAHQLLARLEELGKLKAVITQNIDGLHRAAGSKDSLRAAWNLQDRTLHGMPSFFRNGWFLFRNRERTDSIPALPAMPRSG